MLELHGHKVNPANDTIQIMVMDEPGDGGACHEYLVTLPPPDSLTSPASKSVRLSFQNGPIPKNGVNGITHEVLLAILIHRLDGFQQGPFACSENNSARDRLLDAQRILHGRTRARMDRGVEGTHEK